MVHSGVKYPTGSRAHAPADWAERACVAGAVQRLKGGTSFILRKKFPKLDEFLWGESFWADSYFAESVGTAHEEIIRKYIREQQKDQNRPKAKSPGL